MKAIKIVFFVVTLILVLGGCTNKEIVPSQPSEAVSTEQSKDIEVTPATSKEEPIKQEENKEVVKEQVDSKPVEEVKVQALKKLIVLDPGHAKGGNREMEKTSPYSEILKVKDPGGAVGVSTGLNEYEVNLMVAKKLKTLLEDHGFNVIMTKSTHTENPGNVDRAKVGNDNNADLVLRIHCDSADSSSAKGATMLVPEPVGYAESIYEVSQKYGQIILDNLVSSTGAKNRGISKRKDMTGFNWSKVPVVLVELGFMSNPEEDELLGSEEYQNKIAQGLLKGIKEALEE